MKSKLLWFISLMIVASLVLASCGTPAKATPGQDQPTTAPVVEKKKVTIFVGFGTGTDPDQVKAQEELANIEVEGQSGAGLVKVTMTCKHDVKRVAIDPSLLADDKDMLEDLVAAAFNDGIRRAEEVSQEKMGKLTAGMPMPPGMKFPF